jgi:hypothetical protein
VIRRGDIGRRLFAVIKDWGNEERLRIDVRRGEKRAKVSCNARPMPPPKLRKRPVKYRKLIMAVDKQAAGRMIEVVTPAYLDVLQCFNAIDHPARMNLDAHTAQQSTEEDQVM